jgi:transcriptional regulator with XRE-family HTH domain
VSDDDALVDRPALADFLRRRREALRPDDVGLATGPRRRAPGLRREEVAQLAAMSADYYTRLEQRRGPQPSEPMLASLARALRLDGDERDHLFRLAGRNPPGPQAGTGFVAPALQRVLDRLDDTPALVLSWLGETLVMNRMAVALLGDRSGYRGLARSEVYRWFTDPDDARRMYPPADHDRQSRAQVASLRVAFGVLGPRSRAGEIVRALERRSPEFAELWRRHEVGRRFEDHKVLVHPLVGAIELDCQALFTEDQSQCLLVLTAPPRTDSAEKLALLGVLGTQELGPDGGPETQPDAGAQGRPSLTGSSPHAGSEAAAGISPSDLTR